MITPPLIPAPTYSHKLAISQSMALLDNALKQCTAVNTVPAGDMTNALLDIRSLLQTIKDELLKEIGFDIKKDNT